MDSNGLHGDANPTECQKTEFIWLGTRQQLVQINVSPLQLRDHTLTPFDKARDLVYYWG